MLPLNGSISKLKAHNFLNYMVEGYGDYHGGGFYQNNDKQTLMQSEILEQLRLLMPKLLHLSFGVVLVVAKVVSQINARVKKYKKALDELKDKFVSDLREKMVYKHEISAGTELMEYVCQNMRGEIKQLQASKHILCHTLDDTDVQLMALAIPKQNIFTYYNVVPSKKGERRKIKCTFIPVVSSRQQRFRFN